MLNGGSHGTTEAWGWLQDSGFTDEQIAKVTRNSYLLFVTAFHKEMLSLNELVIEAVDRHLNSKGECTVTEDFEYKLEDQVWVSSHKTPKWTKFLWAVSYYEVWMLNTMKIFINKSSSHPLLPLMKIGSYIFDGMLVHKGLTFDKIVCENEIFEKTEICVELKNKNE